MALDDQRAIAVQQHKASLSHVAPRPREMPLFRERKYFVVEAAAGQDSGACPSRFWRAGGVAPILDFGERGASAPRFSESGG